MYIVETTDEDGNKSYTAANKQGQTVYTAQLDGETPVETCYIYDGFGNLRAVLPPLAVFGSGTRGESDRTLLDYAYLYKYDHRNRCIAKKLPGAGWIYYVYDGADRLIFTQDGESRQKGEWLFSIPDEMGRVVMTGTCRKSLDYASNPLGNTVVKGVYNPDSNTATGSDSYTVTGVSLTGTNILTVNFYDDYHFVKNNINIAYSRS